MGEAIARHVGVQAAGFVGQVFSLHDAEEIRSLVGDAGFHDVAVHVDTRELRLPAPEAFLWQYVHGTPLAGAVAQLDEAGCDALEREVVAGWQAFVEEGSLVLRVRVWVATARVGAWWRSGFGSSGAGGGWILPVLAD